MTTTLLTSTRTVYVAARVVLMVMLYVPSVLSAITTEAGASYVRVMCARGPRVHRMCVRQQRPALELAVGAARRAHTTRTPSAAAAVAVTGAPPKRITFPYWS